jgi:uncharacterized protein
VAELKTRTARMVGDAEVSMEAELTALSERPDPLVTPVPRQPGQRDVRWRHLLGPTVTGMTGAGVAAVAAVQGATAPVREEPAGPASLADRVAALEAEVATLRDQVAELRSHVTELSGDRASMDE